MKRRYGRGTEGDSIDARLMALFYRWLEHESCALHPPGRSLPNEGYVWKKDKLGRYHHGSINLATGKLVPCVSSFTLIRGNVPQRYRNDRVEEFGVIFRGMEELWQGLAIMDCLGGQEEWSEYLIACKLSEERAKRLLEQIWFYLMWQSRKRRVL